MRVGRRLILDEASLGRGVFELAHRDPILGGVVERIGPPPLWPREPGFPTLLLLILEQQVSLASARAAFEKLEQTVSPVTPASLLGLDDATLRGIGFSRQKARYGRILAEAIIDGSLDLEAVAGLGDAEALRALTALTGIGTWTASTYLLMALRRPDVWPAGDVALHAAYQDLAGLPHRPSTPEMVEKAEAWSPWRSVAARILWHHYLGGG